MTNATFNQLPAAARTNASMEAPCNYVLDENEQVIASGLTFAQAWARIEEGRLPYGIEPDYNILRSMEFDWMGFPI